MNPEVVQPKTVEDYLNEVSYEIPEDYVPTDFALKFVNFIKLVNGEEGEESKTPITHYYMLDTLTRSRRILNLCHRGLAKTTLMGEYLFLYLAVYGELDNFGQVDLALYVSDSVENGVKNMRKNLEHRWENSDFLRQYIPKIKFTDIRWEFENIDGKKLIVKGYGSKTGVRGTKELGKRPQLAVLDDLLSDEDARSPTIIASIEDTIYKAVEFALHPKNNMMLWSGTPFNEGDPIYKAVQSGAWACNVFPVCERFPCKKEEFRGSWPDRFSWEFVNEQYQRALKLGKVADFNQELMLRIVSDEERVLTESDFRWYSREDVLRNAQYFNWYITTDFATSKKQTADYSGLMVWAYSSNRDWFLVDGYLLRKDMAENVEELFRYALRYSMNLQEVGIEVTGQQGGFIPWIQKEMIARNIWFNFASHNNSNQPGLRPVTDKLARFNTVLPWFKAGKVYFPEELKETEFMQELTSELLLITRSGIKSRHDDGIDCVSQLSMLNAWEPSYGMPGMGQKTSSENGTSIWDDDINEYEEASGYNSYVV